MPELNKNLLKLTSLLAGVLLLVGANDGAAWAQPAPAPRAVISADSRPEALAEPFSSLFHGSRTISIPGAAWLQLRFSKAQLGRLGTLTITGTSGQSQTFSQPQIEAWEGLSAVFNDSELTVILRSGKDSTEPITAAIENIIIGLPVSALNGTEIAKNSQPLMDLLGPNIAHLRPDDLRDFDKRSVNLQVESPETICGSTDDRNSSSNPRVGRLMPIGCTAWLIESGHLLTAGHCINAAAQTVEFNVPSSQPDGTTISPPIKDQYKVISGSIISKNGGVGNDWAVLQVLPNTQTNLMPAAAQDATFKLSNSINPSQVRITGHGVDGPPPNFGRAPGPRNSQNQTQQDHNGTLLQNTGGSSFGVLSYRADTQGGNSGSPVTVDGTETTIGIHTHGG